MAVKEREIASDLGVAGVLCEEEILISPLLYSVVQSLQF